MSEIFHPFLRNRGYNPRRDLREMLKGRGPELKRNRFGSEKRSEYGRY
jgi:hypothetical protein